MTHNEGNNHGYIRKEFPGGWDDHEKNGFTGENLSEDEKAMKEFIRTVLTWRKNNPVIHTGKLIHYVPSDGVYVLGRYNDEKTVMVVLNQSKKNQILDSDRYAELIGGRKTGKDIITGQSYDLDNDLNVPARTPLILELN